MSPFRIVIIFILIMFMVVAYLSFEREQIVRPRAVAFVHLCHAISILPFPVPPSHIL
jgi:hypothetical protein